MMKDTKIYNIHEVMRCTDGSIFRTTESVEHVVKVCNHKNTKILKLKIGNDKWRNLILSDNVLESEFLSLTPIYDLSNVNDLAELVKTTKKNRIGVKELMNVWKKIFVNR